MEEKRRIELIAITYDQNHSGIHALMLREIGTKRCIRIVVGAAEAQSIKCKMQGIITPRPLTHDLMSNMMRAFGLELQQVYIRRMQDGVYAADLYLTDAERTIVMDSRSSDAIALAIRLGAPIFTSSELLEEVGFEPHRLLEEVEKREELSRKLDETFGQAMQAKGLESYSLNELNQKLQEAVSKEFYEEASKIKAEIERRKNSGE